MLKYVFGLLLFFSSCCYGISDDMYRYYTGQIDLLLLERKEATPTSAVYSNKQTTILNKLIYHYQLLASKYASTLSTNERLEKKLNEQELANEPLRLQVIRYEHDLNDVKASQNYVKKWVAEIQTSEYKMNQHRLFLSTYMNPALKKLYASTFDKPYSKKSLLHTQNELKKLI